jgi:hypothetical protein
VRRARTSVQETCFAPPAFSGVALFAFAALALVAWYAGLPEIMVISLLLEISTLLMVSFDNRLVSEKCQGPKWLILRPNRELTDGSWVR